MSLVDCHARTQCCEVALVTQLSLVSCVRITPAVPNFRVREVRNLWEMSLSMETRSEIGSGLSVENIVTIPKIHRRSSRLRDVMSHARTRPKLPPFIQLVRDEIKNWMEFKRFVFNRHIAPADLSPSLRKTEHLSFAPVIWLPLSLSVVGRHTERRRHPKWSVVPRGNHWTVGC